MLTILWTACNVFGQGSTAGTITGIITDPSGATVPGATVTVSNTATGFSREMKTDSTGNYTFPTLAVSTYELRVSATGFQTAEVANIRLEVNATVRQDIQLKIGAVAQTVEVQSTPPLLNTQNASVGQVIASREVADLPLNGRDFQQLQLLSPGAISTVGSGSVWFFVAAVYDRRLLIQ
jgi:protocatechuate 3,4-dioxygenase beta subunit